MRFLGCFQLMNIFPNAVFTSLILPYLSSFREARERCEMRESIGLFSARNESVVPKAGLLRE